MTPDELAGLHAASFEMPRPWTAAEFRDLMTGRGVLLVERQSGFLLGRVVADEAEVMTLAVRPDARRRGLARTLLAQFLETARARGASRAFLEVAATNAPALALYRQAGFAEAGRRRGYFAHPDGRRIDAVVLSRALDPAG